MSRYKWVRHEGGKLYEVGIRADGALYNPRGYPEDVVRAAVLAADQRRHERRSHAAQKAAGPDAAASTTRSMPSRGTLLAGARSAHVHTVQFAAEGSTTRSQSRAASAPSVGRTC